MPRRELAFAPGEYYHLYNRGVNRERVFFEPENYLFFLRRLREQLSPILEVVAYCLMPTHYHLLVQVKALQTSQTSEVSKTSEVCLKVCSEVCSARVSGAMMRLAVSYTKAVNKRYERVGPLFQGSFQARHVDRNEYLVYLSRYIHLNPQAAGYVEHAEEWQYSSYRDYLGARQGTLPVPGVVLGQFSSPNAYRQFVEQQAPEAEERIAGLLFEESETDLRGLQDLGGLSEP
jgi:REP element-mobilizing transposase RayT